MREHTLTRHEPIWSDPTGDAAESPPGQRSAPAANTEALEDRWAATSTSVALATDATADPCRCRRCLRPLVAARSVARSIGPRCAQLERVVA